MKNILKKTVFGGLLFVGILLLLALIVNILATKIGLTIFLVITLLAIFFSIGDDIFGRE